MSDRPINRRSFFREGLRELIGSIQDAAQPLVAALKQFEAISQEGSSPPPRRPLPQADRPVLRPPGALPEQQFRDTCTRCGDCIRVCPVQCIRIDHDGREGAGFPYIDADAAACAVCDGLVCMTNCAPGALLPTPLAQINMGTAHWHEYTCLRSNGNSCTICVDQCPLGSAAIRLDDLRVEVLASGCIGCGVCQHACPTSPHSIIVVPRAVRPGASPSES